MRFAIASGSRGSRFAEGSRASVPVSVCDFKPNLRSRTGIRRVRGADLADARISFERRAFPGDQPRRNMVRAVLILCCLVLIGNPFCCCSGAGVAAEESEDLPQCCRTPAPAERNAPSTDPEDRPGRSCPCSKRAGYLPAENPPMPAPGPVPLSASSPREPGSPLSAPPSPPRFRANPPERAVRAGSPPLYLLYRVLLC